MTLQLDDIEDGRVRVICHDTTSSGLLSPKAEANLIILVHSLKGIYKI